MAKVYKIHPPIGFARVGNLEIDRSNFATNIYMNLGTGIYKNGRKIIPIPADFSIWEHEVNTSGVIINSTRIDLNSPNVEIIEWSVQLANLKAAFYNFNGKNGEASPNSGFRNINYNNWKMQPRAVKISGKGVSNKIIKHVPNGTDKINKQVYLGSLWTDSAGNLTVLGGKGDSQSTRSTMITHYANNPYWYDDVSDGPVSVVLKFKGQVPSIVEPSWVIVGPPDYAPEIESIVSLYDMLVDMTITNMGGKRAIYNNLLNYPNLASMYNNFSAYKPNFHDDILPILERTINFKNVSSVAKIHTVFPVLKKIDDLIKNKTITSNSLTKGERDQIFASLRDPTTGNGRMPKLHGDSHGTTGMVDQYLSLTKTQYELVKRWKDDNFVKSSSPSITNEPFLSDMKLLKTIVGGAFFPGIEVGWQIRNSNLFKEPFRINHTAIDQYKPSSGRNIKAGHFTRQMALPWQADFTACQTDSSIGWWPAQRPDDVPDGTGGMLPWFRDSGNNRLNDWDLMVNKWIDLGFVISDGKGGFKEEFRNP